MLIASLGLLEMVVYSLEQRTKEISIRKVSLAPVINIFMLISKGYTKLILVAFFIGAPLAYYMMQFCLIDFVYEITGYHAIKAALSSPVEVL